MTDDLQWAPSKRRKTKKERANGSGLKPPQGGEKFTPHMTRERGRLNSRSPGWKGINGKFGVKSVKKKGKKKEAKKKNKKKARQIFGVDARACPERIDYDIWMAKKTADADRLDTPPLLVFPEGPKACILCVHTSRLDLDYTFFFTQQRCGEDIYLWFIVSLTRRACLVIGLFCLRAVEDPIPRFTFCLGSKNFELIFFQNAFKKNNSTQISSPW